MTRNRGTSRANSLYCPPLSSEEESRFWAKVQRGPADGCWSWKGSTSRTGYGRFKIGRNT